ncbi:MAG TPA: sulfatase-like hydrolase/transferase [Candidatus Binatia bacterium]|nr:sulfatase-like hydrolase/transferase [Candidatus Binatia bacterium]
MGRKILFITTDQQRFDSLGCNGGTIARTPVADRLAATGINYRRAHNQNVVCMPARSTMITGQYVRTHGVVANGVPLPADAPSVAAWLHGKAGYRTALLGKAHFEPGLDPDFRWFENRMARDGSTGPYRGFEHVELAVHGWAFGRFHYDKWLAETYPGEQKGFYRLFTRDGMNHRGGGDTGAPQVAHNPIPREHYHTDWVADRTIAWLDGLDAADDWFVWMSFPDPHHPWDPPLSAVRRIPWRELDLPAGHPGSHERIVGILAQKPHHWLDWYEGRFDNLEGGPPHFVPCRMTHDQVREVNALVHVENELIDEACGRVLARIAERGWDADTDVFFTTDHGELQGDFGLLFKGPYHVDALMRLPFIWRPAPSAAVPPAVIDEPVGQLDLAPTFCRIAGVPIPDWIQGAPLPTMPGSGRERVLTEWDSQFGHIDMHLRSIYRDHFVCTAYERGRTYAGTEGELYDLREDPLQWRNLWDDPGYTNLRKDLLADLYDHLPPPRDPPLGVEAPA